jgi:hypothetical protein
MNHTLKNLLALAFFIISLSFLFAATSIQNNNALNESLLVSGNCHHCGSISACRDGGQAYGWTACDYFPGSTPPDNCVVHGSSECGGTDPGEAG